ncbi:MAG: hypothetical protein ACRDK3_14955 [Actinomycetota bacterium]
MRRFQPKSSLIALLVISLIVLFASISSGAPGDPLILGQPNSAETTDTSLTTTSDGNAFSVVQSGIGTGIYGEGDAYGIYGYTAGSGGYGGHSGSGVYGEGGRYGVYGYSTTSDGWGVYGGSASSGRGVSGTSKSGTGVHAESGVNGNALRVVGKAVFSKSGILTIPSGASSVTKSGVNALTSSSFVLAQLQQNASGRWVRSVVPNVANGSFTIYLNRSVTSDTSVAWFVVN